MKQFRSVTTNVPMGVPIFIEETIYGEAQTSLLQASSLAVHLAPSYGRTRIEFEWREEGDQQGWVRMSGQDVLIQVLEEVLK